MPKNRTRVSPSRPNPGYSLLLLALLAVCAAAADQTIHRYAATGSIEIAFTPGDRIDRLVIAAIDAGRSEVLVQAFSFTDHSIARALLRARLRGVTVRVVADREQARQLPQNVLPELAAGGVEVWLDGNFQAAHNKVVIIDADSPHATTITGSYNFTIAAQRGNAENVIVLRDNTPVARAYRENWERLHASALAWSADALR
jgi:phosphatidylserine/phosphatidylglycerophosphate/cardiolipin synthase-like enzyme